MVLFINCTNILGNLLTSSMGCSLVYEMNWRRIRWSSDACTGLVRCTCMQMIKYHILVNGIGYYQVFLLHFKSSHFICLVKSYYSGIGYLRVFLLHFKSSQFIYLVKPYSTYQHIWKTSLWEPMDAYLISKILIGWKCLWHT